MQMLFTVTRHGNRPIPEGWSEFWAHHPTSHLTKMEIHTLTFFFNLGENKEWEELTRGVDMNKNVVLVATKTSTEDNRVVLYLVDNKEEYNRLLEKTELFPHGFIRSKSRVAPYLIADLTNYQGPT